MGLFDGTPLERPVVCETCGQPEAECVCPPPAAPHTPSSEQRVRLAIEKRKNGKAVTVIRGLIDEGQHLSEVLSLLKSTCGAGGTAKDGEIEIQGRQIERMRETLIARGYRVTNG